MSSQPSAATTPDELRFQSLTMISLCRRGTKTTTTKTQQLQVFQLNQKELDMNFSKLKKGGKPVVGDLLGSLVRDRQIKIRQDGENKKLHYSIRVFRNFLRAMN